MIYIYCERAFRLSRGRRAGSIDCANPSAPLQSSSFVIYQTISEIQNQQGVESSVVSLLIDEYGLVMPRPVLLNIFYVRRHVGRQEGERILHVRIRSIVTEGATEVVHVD